MGFAEMAVDFKKSACTLKLLLSSVCCLRTVLDVYVWLCLDIGRSTMKCEMYVCLSM